MIKMVITMNGAEEKNVSMELVKQFAEVLSRKSMEASVDMRAVEQKTEREQKEIKVPEFLQKR